MNEVEKIIKKLKLEPLKPEGGMFVETYRSQDFVEINGNRKQLSTAIYYLLRKGQICKPHRLKSDEIWHFYYGDPVNIYLLNGKNKLEKIILGKNLLKGEKPQIVIPKMVWQAAELKKGGNFALLGTTVSPAFDFEDLEMADFKTRNIFGKKFSLY